MKNKLIGVLLLSSLLFVGYEGSNRQIFDTKWEFRKAIIFMGNDTIEVNVKSWKDYDDTTIQVTDINDKTYLTDLKNVILSE